MKVLITGSDGFIAKNLICHLKATSNIEILKFDRNEDVDELLSLVDEAELIFHLAGSNRPNDSSEFTRDNIELTSSIVNRLLTSSHKKKIIFSSSIKAKSVLGITIKLKMKYFIYNLER